MLKPTWHWISDELSLADRFSFRMSGLELVVDALVPEALAGPFSAAPGTGCAGSHVGRDAGQGETATPLSLVTW
jgi:hypothetical protein